MFNKLYDKIKQTKPEAIKPRKSKAKKSTKRKVTGKQGVFMKLAKSIRDKNPNLTWKQAQAKASAELKESREKETKKLNSEIEKFVKNNKEYQKAFGAGMHPFTKTFSDIKEAQWFERAMKRSNFITKLLTVTE